MAAHNYRIALNGSIAGQFSTCVMAYTFDDAGFASTFAAALALLTAWGTANKALWLSMLPADYTFLSIKARAVGVSGGFEAIGFPTAPIIGTRAGNSSASGIAPCIVHFPLDNIRSRGRTFLPGLSETDCEDGNYTNAYKTAIATVLGTIFDNITLVGGGNPTAQFGVLKRNNTVFDSDQHVLSPVVGTIRRRQVPV